MLAVTIVLAACSAPAPTAEPASASSAELPSAAASESPTSADAPSVSASPTPSDSPDSCTDDVLAGIEQTINGQQDAFARGDYAEARTFASQTFQASVTEEQFALIIGESYGFLLDDPQVEILKCAQLGDLAQVVVRVSSSPPVGMSYRLVLEEPGWRIDGATVVAEQDTVEA